MPDLERLLTVDDVAETTGLSTETVRRAIRAGELPAAKIRRRIRIRPVDVADWIERSRIEAVPLSTPGGAPIPQPRTRKAAPLGGYQQRARDAA